MLIGFLLPLLRRFSARRRVLISAVVMTAGVALAATVVLHGRDVLLVRLGLLLTLAGLGLLVSSVRAYRQESMRQSVDAERADGQP